MKVQITPYTVDANGKKTYGTPFDLTGSVPAEQVSGFDLNGKNELELIEAIRASSVDVRDRGNQANQLSFQINRTHDSGGAAAYFVFTHLIALPRVGRVTLTFYDDNGATIGTIYLNDAGIQGHRALWAGASTVYNYVIVGGAPSTKAA